MSDQKIKFCCSFKTIDGMNHPKWVSDKGLTLEKAKAWAEWQVKFDDWLAYVDDVYPVTQR